MDLFECAVCLSDMVDRTPRSLQCLHSFCTECLSQLINHNKIECPICREITELKNNNVRELKVNFMLCQFKEREKKSTQATANPNIDQPKSLCQICQRTEAVYKCKDCPHLMCVTCMKNHGEIEEFKAHSVFDLCQKHKEGITHLCRQCVRPLCMRCMLLDDKEHKTHFVKFDQGIEELQKGVKGLQENIRKEIEMVDKNHTGIDAKYEMVTEIETGLKEQMNEVCQLLQDTENNKKIYADIKEKYKKDRNGWTVAAASLNSLISSKTGFCERYQKLKHKAEQSLADIKKAKSVEYNVPTFVLAEPSPGELVKQIQTEHKVKNLKMVKTVLTVDKSDEINGEWDIVSIGSDVSFPTNTKPYHVIRLNQKGEVGARYYPQDTEKQVWSVAVYDKDIYMLQNNIITVITHEKNITYNINNSNMCKILVKDKSTIIFSQNKNPGYIYKYDTNKDTTEVLVQGLNYPTYMSMMYIKDGYRYIVTEEGAHCIKVYNHRWELLHSFGHKGSADGQFNLPCGTEVTDMGTILIADQVNHRISHYAIDGRLLSHVVTKDDGLEYPKCLSYKNKYLWVIRGFANYIKCFEIAEI